MSSRRMRAGRSGHHPAAPPTAEVRPQAGSGQAAAAGQPHILVIDDNQADLELFGEALLEMGEAVVCRTAKSIDQGIALIDQHAPPAGTFPNVIILDLRLPGHDGKHLLQHLRQRPDTQGVPVVMLSSSNWQKDRDECLRLGASHYRVKPQDWNGYKELVAFLRPFWGQPAAEPG